VNVLDRIFDGHDVARALAVDPIDEGRQGGRLAASGRPVNST
jgi:hypothetical protein